MAVLSDAQREAGWTEHRLSDVIELIGGGTPKTTVEEYWNGSIPWLSVVDFSGDSRYVSHASKSITQLGLENSSTKLLNPGDLILSARGTVGELAQLTAPMAFNQSCFGIRSNFDGLVQNYLYYLLLTVIGELRQNSHGSIFSTVNRKTFESVDIVLPPLEEQERIAGILGSLDDKIEANTRLIQTIKEYMAALYKAEAKNGKVLELTDIADFVNGRAFTKDATGTGRVVIRIAELNNGLGASTVYNDIEVKEENTAYPGDVLMSWSGSLDTYVWHLPEAIINQHIFKVIPKDSYPKWLVYHACKSVIEDFQAIAVDKATTMGHIRRGDLKRDISIPAQEMPQMENLWNLWMNLEQENLQLAATRDALIKRLIG